ncbi:hypothetical protein ACFV28_31980 [Streptomyces sp. NPDC059720]|uniref:hypothetical protein n=1 Tax=Streptomyces sp. NPDC059720 TaxID=3346924 RepID=UPI0036B8293F
MPPLRALWPLPAAAVPQPDTTKPASVGAPDDHRWTKQAENTPHRTGRHLVVHTVAASAHRAGRPDRAALARGGADGTRLGTVPPDQAPGGRSDGALGNRSAADQGTPRHVAPHALTPGLRVPPQLLPGAAARRTGAAGVRDAQRDIPLFPG